MKLIIAGSRSFSHEFLGGIFPDFTSNCHQAVHQLMGIEADIKEIVHGGCPSGVDSFADLQWDSYYDIIETSVFKADWNKYGKFAGPKCKFPKYFNKTNNKCQFCDIYGYLDI